MILGMCNATCARENTTGTPTTLTPARGARINKWRQAMSKWLVVTEVESTVDPAIWNYVNGTTLVSSQLMEEDSNE
jgi:hypothetical protein